MPRDEQDLTAALRHLRPAPRPEFATALDAQAAAGFPRDDRVSRSPIATIVRRLRFAQPRHLLTTAAACALAAFAIGTAAILTSDGGRSARENIAVSMPRAQAPAPPTRIHPFSRQVAPAEGTAESAVGSVRTQSRNGLFDSIGPYASRARHRAVERSTWIVLGANPGDVRGDSTKVFEVVHANGGIVMRSSTQEGAAGEAGASFDLLIPSNRLGDALTALSGIGQVRSRHESTQDITSPTIGIGEKLQDRRATVASLLAQLAAAPTEVERAAVESRLRRERDRAAALRSRLDDLQRRASFSRVSVRIETRDTGSSGNGDWGLGDGLRTAGRVLAVAAGVSLIGLAAFVPLALVVLLVWLVQRAWLRRARERSLA